MGSACPIHFDLDTAVGLHAGNQLGSLSVSFAISGFGQWLLFAQADGRNLAAVQAAELHQMILDCFGALNKQFLIDLRAAHAVRVAFHSDVVVLRGALIADFMLVLSRNSWV